MADNLYYQKYLKYKTKYFNLKMLYKNNQLGGNNFLSKTNKCGYCNSLNSFKCEYCNGLKSFSKNNQSGGNNFLSKTTKCGYCNNLNSLKCDYCNDLKSFSKNNQLGGGKSHKSDVYLFKADWCGHCKGFKSTWDKLKKELSSKYTFITLDADADKDKISSWNIQGFPTIIKKSGVNATEYVGQRDEQSVREFIQSN